MNEREKMAKKILRNHSIFRAIINIRSPWILQGGISCAIEWIEEKEIKDNGALNTKDIFFISFYEKTDLRKVIIVGQSMYAVRFFIKNHDLMKTVYSWIYGGMNTKSVLERHHGTVNVNVNIDN
jgi:hypothetical protein